MRQQNLDNQLLAYLTKYGYVILCLRRFYFRKGTGMITRRIFGGLASLLLGGAALLSGGSIASANESADESQSEVVLMVFRDGEWIPLASVEDEGELKHPDSSAQLDSEISPFLLSSIDIWQCNLPVSEHVITTYYTPWNGELMPIDLKSGNSAFGYNHIKAGH